MSEASCFAVRRGEIAQRADVNHALSTHFIAELYAHPNYPLTPLSQLIKRVQYGSSKLATSEPIGLPMIRMNNLQGDGWDLTDLKYVELSPQEAETYRLIPGDLLFNRTNSKELVGKCEVFRETGHWVFASYLIRVTMDNAKALPDFISTFLSTSAGRAQIDRISRQIVGMSNVNAEELKSLLIPLPDIDVQHQLVIEMNRARAVRQQTLAQADALLAGIDNYLLEQLGLTPPPQERQQVFAVRLRDAKTRCDRDYHSPHFRRLREAIEQSQYPVVPISDICLRMQTGFAAGRNDQAETAKDGIPHIRPTNITQHGELTFLGTKYVPLTDVGSEDLLKAGEVLFNNTNSMLWVGKTAVFDSNSTCACSNHITRLVLNPAVADPHFIAALFNAFRSTGLFGLLATNFNNQAGINTQTLASLRIPLPMLEQQNEIFMELEQRRAEARRLRREAEQDWTVAKREFERKLLGKVA